MRVAPPIYLTEEQAIQLRSWARGRRTEARLVRRAKIVLLAAEGKENNEIAAALPVMPRIVALWRGRFLKLGLEGLSKDAPRSGRKPSVTAEKGEGHRSPDDRGDSPQRHSCHRSADRARTAAAPAKTADANPTAELGGIAPPSDRITIAETIPAVQANAALTAMSPPRMRRTSAAASPPQRPPASDGTIDIGPSKLSGRRLSSSPRPRRELTSLTHKTRGRSWPASDPSRWNRNAWRWQLHLVRLPLREAKARSR